MNAPTEQRSFYRGTNLTLQVLGGIGGVLMVALSVYLTKHYFDVHFPTGLGSSGLCDINAFFNCDVATNSFLSNIAGVPISLLGLFMGLFVLFGFIFNGEKVEGTIHALLWLNGAGCIFLFLFSLIALGGLCPACTLYYVASLLVLFCFHKTSDIRGIGVPVLLGYGLTVVVVFGVTFGYVSNKKEQANSAKSKLAQGLISQFENLPKLGTPKFDSEFRMDSMGGAFKDAPVRITKFSDFECPACKMLSQVLHKIEKKYAGKVAIQYFFYPLDNNCNPEMKRALHQNACKAAYLAACLPSKFQEVEEKIFNNQESLSYEWIENEAKGYGVMDCFKDSKTQEKVLTYIKQAEPFGVKSTPTFLLNGVKIEGVLPENQLSILIDHILKK